MYVLFIPSFPNNRFHLGNIRTTKRKNKRRKGERERRSRSLVSSLQTLCIVYSLKLCGNFVTFFFVFYILYNRKRALTRALEQTLITFVSFLFLSFLFFWNTNKSLNLGDLRRQRLELLSLLSGLHCKETRGAPGQVRLLRHVDGFSFFVVFELKFRLIFSNYRAGARKSDSAFACAAERNVFYSEHSFPCNVKK